MEDKEPKPIKLVSLEERNANLLKRLGKTKPMVKVEYPPKPLKQNVE